MNQYDLNIKKNIENLSDNILFFKKTKVIESIIKILNDIVDKIDFNKTNLEILDNIPEALMLVMSNNHQLSNNSYYDKLKNIQTKIDNILYSKAIFLTPKEEKCYLKLENFYDSFNEVLEEVYGKPITENDSLKLEFVKYVIFELKYINIFKSVIKTHPNILNIDGKEPIILLIVNKYLMAIDKNNISDIVYYNKVLHAIKECDIYVDKYTCELMIHTLNHKKDTKNDFYIDDIINCFENKPIIINDEYINKLYNVDDKFSVDVLYEAKDIYINNKIKEKPINSKIYTFDGHDAKEIDDGLSVEYRDGVYHLGVHIADPTAYIKPNSKIFNEAKNRTTTLYFDNGFIPMYPLNLSGDLMSLNEQKLRNSITYHFYIDKYTHELIDFSIENKPIIVENNFTYDYLDYVLTHGSENGEFEQFVINLNNVSSILKEAYDEDAIYKDYHEQNHSSAATEIIASAMIYTNKNIAYKFFSNDLPFIYRCHKLDYDRVNRLEEIENSILNSKHKDNIIKDINMVKNLLPRAYYSTHNEGHYGLGIDYYSHATSPLRRLSDNYINLCIKKFLLGNYNKEDIKIYKDELEKICEEINSKRINKDMYSIEKSYHK